MLDKLLSLTAPHRCYSCGHNGVVWCARCEYDISDEPFGHCLLCARPLSSNVDLCNSCHNSSALSAAWCVGWRSDRLRELIDDYKFYSAKEAVKVLGRMLDSRLPFLDEATITEVPTVHGHVRQLGYDHAQLLAKELARSRRLPYRSLLSRSGRQIQHFSTLQERQKQASSLFAGKRPIQGDILLLDDIVTTGISLEAAAKALKAAGADKVYAAVLVRQPRNQ